MRRVIGFGIAAVVAVAIGLLVAFGTPTDEDAREPGPSAGAQTTAVPNTTAAEGSTAPDAETVSEPSESVVVGTEANELFRWTVANDSFSSDFQLAATRGFTTSVEQPDFALVVADAVMAQDQQLTLALLASGTSQGSQFVFALAGDCRTPVAIGALQFTSLSEVRLVTEELPAIGASLSSGARRPDCDDGAETNDWARTLTESAFEVSPDDSSLTLVSAEGQLEFALRPRTQASSGEVDPTTLTIDQVLGGRWLQGASNFYNRGTGIATQRGDELDGVSLTVQRIVSPEADRLVWPTVRYLATFSDACGATLRRGHLIEDPTANQNVVVSFQDAAPAIGFESALPGCVAEYPAALEELLLNPFVLDLAEPVTDIEIGSPPRPFPLTLRLVGNATTIDFTAPDRSISSTVPTSSQRAAETYQQLEDWIRSRGEGQTTVGFANTEGIVSSLGLLSDSDASEIAIELRAFNYPDSPEQPLGFDDRLSVRIRHNDLRDADGDCWISGRLVIDGAAKARLVRIPLQDHETTLRACEAEPNNDLLAVFDEPFDLSLSGDFLRITSSTLDLDFVLRPDLG